MRDMEFFMNIAPEGEFLETEIEGIAKFKFPKGHEKEGQKIPWVLKPISTQHLDEIRATNTTARRVKNNIIKDVDSLRVTHEMMVETIVYPNFKDPNWLKASKCIDSTELLLKVLDLPGDFARISTAVVEANGISGNEEDLIKEAKNS